VFTVDETYVSTVSNKSSKNWIEREEDQLFRQPEEEKT
jgi:hypothetical protein